MAMNYNTLMADKNTEGSIKYYVNHDKTPSADIIVSAHAFINQKLRCREMITRATGTIALGSETFPLPVDFLEPISMSRGGYDKGPIVILDQQHFEDRLVTDETDQLLEGTPTECTFDAANFLINAKADKTYYYRLWYMANVPVLTNAQQTNFLTSRYPNMLEGALKYYAYKHREEDGLANDWMAVAVDAINTANAEFDMFKQSIQFEMYWSK